MRLHYHPLSSYSRKVRSALLIRGDAHETHVIEVFKGELKSPEYLSLNPFGKMPVLVTDRGPIIESTSIIEWLEERGPRVLLPAGSERMAREFDRLGDLYLLAPTSALWWRRDSDEGKKAPEVARKAWAMFEKQLDGKAFITGDTISLGDLSGAIGTDYLHRLGVEAPPAIRAWMSRCYEVAGMRESLTEAMPFIQRGLAMREEND
jgi:glutathione S-transferase